MTDDSAKPRVLIADDEDSLSGILRRRLAEHGLEMVWARDGEEALELIGREDFAAAALDYRMPRRDGLEVLRAIRAAGNPLPVVIISGMGSLEVAVEAIRLGAADYVVKDISGAYLDLLPATVNRLIERRRLIEEKERAQAETAAQSLLLSATFDNINQGLCVFDAELRLLAHNQRFLDLYEYPEALGEPATPLEAFFRVNAERGDYGPGDPAALVAARLERARDPRPHIYEHYRSDGQVIEVRGAPMPGGGFVSTHTDVSDRKRLERALRNALTEQTTLLETSLVGICLVSDRRFMQVNSKMAEMFGYHRDELIGQPTRILHPDDESFAAFGDACTPVLLRGEVFWVEKEMRRRDGSLIWCLLQGRAVDPAAPERGSTWNLQDISERKRAEEHMHLAQGVFQAAGEGIMVIDRFEHIETVNPAFSELTGFSAEEVRGKPPSILHCERHDEGFYTGMWQQVRDTGRWEGDIWTRRRDGSLFAQRISIRALADEAGQAGRYVAIFHDITHRKEDEERAWVRANYDALTGLPNRSLFLDRLHQAQAQADREGTRFALLFIDLDGFKEVNDRLGHAAGDDLLQQVARRLLESVRSIDTVGRLGGDEFVVILGGISHAAAAATVARKVLEELARPFDLGRSVAQISGSIGLALYPHHAPQLAALLEIADQAMYQAKRAGKNRVSLAPEPV